MLKDNRLVFEDIDKLSEQLAYDILEIAKTSIRLSNSFKIVLTGGDSVLKLYKILSNSKSSWSKWHIYISDERCFPTNHRDRNDRVINEIWLDGSLIPKNNIHFIQAELGLLKARVKYERVLNEIDKFDIVLLSMGEDGHVASLFPNHSYTEDKSVVIEQNSPKNPKERISMSFGRINMAKNIFKIIIGKKKQEIFNSIKKDLELPIDRISGDSNKIFMLKID